MGIASMIVSGQQYVMNDINNAMTVRQQMMADSQKQAMRRWQIMQDTQTKIFEIQQDVTVNKAKTQDKMFQKWDQYIRQ